LLYAASTVADSFNQSMGQYGEDWREQQVGLMKATMLLTGLAVENALKGLAAARGEGVVVASDRLPLEPPFSNHDLPGMAAKLKLEIDGEASDLLKRLSQAVRWGGRYPIPRRESQMPKDGVSLSMLPTDVDRAKKLVETIDARVRAI
jgi:hypothetical protein